MATLRPTRLLTRHLPRLTSTQTPLSKPLSTRLSPSRPSPSPSKPTPFVLSHKSAFHTTLANQKTSSDPPLPSGIPPSTLYTFTDIQTLLASPSPTRILIDVREPSELLSGRIPGALNIPIQSAPDSFFLSAEDFEDKYGVPRPSEADEVVFYCKAGVRSRAAARLAGQAGFGGKIGEYPGSWVEWIGMGGEVQKD